VDNTEPASLLKRAEQLMFHAETIVDKALDEKDYRLVLAAIGRARPSMELVMRATGQIGSDGTTIERRCEAPKRRTVREAVD
jgi:ribosomal protein S7